MAKKSGNFFALLTGMAAGAAAVFFSDKKNRQMAKKTAQKAVKLKEEYDKDPAGFKKKAKAEGKKLAKEVRTSAQKKAAQVKKQVKRKATKATTKKATSQKK